METSGGVVLVLYWWYKKGDENILPRKGDRRVLPSFLELGMKSDPLNFDSSAKML